MSEFENYTSDYSILFDLDGTIIDSRLGIIETLHKVIAALGHHVEPSIDLEWVVGPPLPDLMRTVIADYGDNRVEMALSLYKKYYDEEGQYQTPLFPAIKPLLHELKESSIQLFIATSKPASLASRILERHDLSSCFNEIGGAADDESGGEKSALIGRIVTENHLRTEKAIMVGDRCFDIRGARANRMASLGVLWGYGSRQELIAAGADHLVQTADQLRTAIAHHLAHFQTD